jgi:hypothetical protein
VGGGLFGTFRSVLAILHGLPFPEPVSSADRTILQKELPTNKDASPPRAEQSRNVSSGITETVKGGREKKRS